MVLGLAREPAVRCRGPGIYPSWRGRCELVPRGDSTVQFQQLRA
jgi:hypothetical protein